MRWPHPPMAWLMRRLAPITKTTRTQTGFANRSNEQVACYAMKRWVLAVGVAAAAVSLGVSVIELEIQKAASTSSLPEVSAAAALGRSAMRVVATGPEAARVGARMQANESIANDVIFLIVATLRGRCQPSLAHDLPRMAVIARLPLLSSDGEADPYPESLRHDISHIVNAIVERANCTQPLTLQIGSYSSVLDPEVYARSFPDSYFDPTVVAASKEALGANLEQRVADSCTAVVYAKLPLDDARAWQCTGLRRNARAAILHVCHSEGEMPQRAAADIQHVIDGLPVTCQ